MNALITNMANQRSKELRDYASRRRLAGRRSRRTRSARPASRGLERVSIRRLDSDGADSQALVRLAGRDSRPSPTGEVLGAVLDERLIAAISVTTGDLVADPFTRTDDIRSLLELRAEQLRTTADDRHVTRLHLPRPSARPRRS